MRNWDSFGILRVSSSITIGSQFLFREQGSGTREVFDGVTGQAGFIVLPVWEAMSTAALVNAGINGLDFKRKFKIIYHKEKFLTPSAREFIKLCWNYELNDS